MAKLILKGTYTALITPFTNKGDVDFNALKALIDFQITGGVEGIVVCGSTGESATLSQKEKIAIITTAVEHAKGRTTIIAGTGSNNTQDTVDLTTIAKELGVAAALIVAPYYNKPTQEGLYYHYKTVADAVNLPQIIYNVPGRAGVNISPEIQLQLAKDCKNIIATKEASGNLDQIMNIIQNAPKDFTVLSGDDSLTLPVVYMGGHGVISVLSNYAPKMFSDAVRYAQKGDIKKANELHYKLAELMNLNFIESNPIPVKAALNIMGYCKDVYRLPLTPIRKENKVKIKEALKRAKLI
jgi:4-hydroxy-tetrahydrodipicolinate synthase